MTTYKNFPGRGSLCVAGDEGLTGFEFVQICHSWASPDRSQSISLVSTAHNLTGNAKEDVRTSQGQMISGLCATSLTISPFTWAQLLDGIIRKICVISQLGDSSAPFFARKRKPLMKGFAIKSTVHE